MAMNKKELAIVADMKQEIAEAKALRFTQVVHPDVGPPNTGLSAGFMHTGGFDFPRVVPACSGPVSHGIGSNDKTSSQKAIWLYSSELLALKGLRNEMERSYAKKLARVDAMIADIDAEAPF